MSSNPISRSCLEQLARLGMLRNYLKEDILNDIATKNRLKDEESDQLLEQFKNSNKLDDDQALETFAAQNLLKPSDIRLLAERPISIQRYIDNQFKHNAEAHFLHRKDNLDQVVYSLIRVGRESLARELHMQIGEGEADISTLAAEYSQGPERQTRGLVGPVPLNQAHPLLSQRLRSAQPSELLKPFQIEQWWLVVRLEQKLEASFDEQTAQRMASELFEQWLSQAVEQQLRVLTKPAEVK